MQQFSLFDQCVMLPYNKDVRERCLQFTCGDTDLDDFFHNDAERYAAELMGKTYCWITEQKPHRIVALFTLANDSIKIYPIPLFFVPIAPRQSGHFRLYSSCM